MRHFWPFGTALSLLALAFEPLLSGRNSNTLTLFPSRLLVLAKKAASAAPNAERPASLLRLDRCDQQIGLSREQDLSNARRTPLPSSLGNQAFPWLNSVQCSMRRVTDRHCDRSVANPIKRAQWARRVAPTVLTVLASS